jgi:malonyl-CoA/methylmalonyl-CoA synthetase
VPLPSVMARIRAADRLADPGTDSEIQLRGPHVFAGYWNDPAATEAAFTHDGWFRTGDLGTVDPATWHLVICGRTKEMIITGGLNVYPREVEIALEGYPSVAVAAAAGAARVVRRWRGTLRGVTATAALATIAESEQPTGQEAVSAVRPRGARNHAKPQIASA